MARVIDSSMEAELPAPVIIPCWLALLTFRSETMYVWSGRGPLVYGGNTYVGVGTLGSVGDISEGVDVQADGTSVSLSGIDIEMLAEAMTDIKSGALAKLWFGAMANGAIIGSPYLQFVGVIDEPTITISEETATITLALESRLVDLSRASMRRYTAADQNLTYPHDTAFNYVEADNDLALRWGT